MTGMAFVNAAAILFVLAMAAVMPRQGRALVMVSPAADQTHVYELIASAGGQFVSGTAYPNMAIAQFDPTRFSSAGLVAHLFASGALMVLDGDLAIACLKERP